MSIKKTTKKENPEQPLGEAENEVKTEQVAENTQAQSKNGIVIAGIVIAAAIIALLLFSQKQTIPGTSPLQNPISNTGEVTEKKEFLDIVETGSNVKVDYVGKLEDGTIFDTSIEEYAKKMKNYDPKAERKYEPLSFTVGAGQMIKGFDEGVIGMKLGEKKTLTLAPKDAYGEAFTTQKIPAKFLKDTIEQDVPADNFKDTISRSFSKDTLGGKADSLKVGDPINEGGIEGKITSITETGVTIEINNNQNPFYGKKLVVGLEGEYQGNKLKISKITDENVTVVIDNKQNPFYGKELKEGLVGKLPNGEDVKITKISGEDVEVEIKNQHELAGKTLIFDVEIKEITR